MCKVCTTEVFGHWIKQTQTPLLLQVKLTPGFIYLNLAEKLKISNMKGLNDLTNT